MFESAKLKLEWANEHLQDLESLFKGFVADNPPRIEPSADGKVGHVRADAPVPSRFALMLGDTIHNLYTVLDHATWELIGRDGGTQNRHTIFPTGGNRISYEATCRGMITPRTDTKDFLVALGAYAGGPGRLLYYLKQLEIADKHVIITPVIGASAISNMILINSSLAFNLERVHLFVDSDGKVRITRRSTTPANSGEEVQMTAEICFGNMTSRPSVAIIPTLVAFENAVAGTLGEFERFVTARTP